jgi:hypothetical protein
MGPKTNSPYSTALPRTHPHTALHPLYPTQRKEKEREEKKGKKDNPKRTKHYTLNSKQQPQHIDQHAPKMDYKLHQ